MKEQTAFDLVVLYVHEAAARTVLGYGDFRRVRLVGLLRERERAAFERRRRSP